ncbi:hypothetical protein GRI97_03890 [Altererythrobacter xixiisoli]|uniref:SecDF P1 head subdomain domain-containing protein n=1 Tax=Croceibacterium xixiisoli TaxID=1476466 RepID=A0A6I4TTC6_9SPHN|nr:hypothetical protein [Croceibacterium xixiisoli]MXO98127.1 hypothetical protein [Croceibacterium xixiisoli]
MMGKTLPKLCVMAAVLAAPPALVQAQDQAEAMELAIAKATLAKDDFTGETVLDLELEERSVADFARITTDNIGRALALKVNGQTLTRPTINAPITSGQIRISPGMDPDQPDLATVVEELQADGAVITVEVQPRETDEGAAEAPSRNIPSP